MKAFGLKAKILLGLTAILLLITSSNLYFTNNLIIEDKKAYIFENILSNTEEVRNLINENIQNSLLQVESLSLLSQMNNSEWKTLFEKQGLIDAFFIKRVTEDRPTKSMRSSFPNKNDDYSSFVSSWIDGYQELDKFGLEVQKIQDQNVFEVKLKDDTKSFGLLLDMEQLWNRLSADSVFNYIILDSAGNVLWRTGKDVSKNLYSGSITSNAASQSKEVSVNGTDYLMSVSSVPDIGIHVVSYIASDKAYAIVGDLSVKTVAFGLILLGFSLILGLLFSSKLTNPIRSLVEGVLHIAQGNFSHQVVVKSKDELAILGDKFNFMSGKIKDLLGEKEVIIDELKDANAKIEDYSKNLERKVEERTRELKSANDFIQAMINSLDQGLFVFGPDLMCSSIYTKACEDLFNKIPAGQRFEEVLSLDEDQKSRTPKWADILFNEKIPFDSAAQLGVLEKEYGESVESDDYKLLKLHYHPMRDEDTSSISNVVVVATDKTEEARAIQETKKKERYVEMIYKILGAKRQFIDFTNEVDDYLKSLDQVLESPEIQLDSAMLIYHSFTGGFGMYAVDSLMDEVRKCEQTLVDMKKSQKIDKELLMKQKADFQNNYFRFKDEIFNTLGFNTNMVEVDLSVILYLNDLVRKTDNKELKHIFDERIMKVPVEEYLTPYKNLLPALALKLGKEIAPLAITNGDIRVDPDKFREFFSLLVHLFRNCADHGIEMPSVREEREKSYEGHITVTSQLEDNGRLLKIVVEDDGGGIDPERIRSRLQKNNPDKELSNESDDEIIYHIFDQDFSTAEQVTTISGRGVGMSAIKDIVERMQGRIKLESQVGKGTKFIFELPV